MARAFHSSALVVFAFFVFGCSAFILVQSSPSQSQSRAASARSLQYIGVNIASGSFAADKLPGAMFENYVYPENSTIDYFSSKGMNIIRLAVLWERLQYQLMSPLHESDMAKIDAVVDYARSKGMKTIIDVHNYAKYNGSVIGTRNLPPPALADLWRRISLRYKDNDYVVFGLMNEPTGLPTETWLKATNLAIKSIRKTGARNLILVPGNGYSSARDWLKSQYGTPNSKLMLGVTDPAKNWMFEVHQYFDRNFTGTSSECQSTEVALATLMPFTEWARKNRQRGFLGEFGVGRDRHCLEVLDQVLNFLQANSDVWTGWAYWAAGPWWPTGYFTDIEPVEGKDRPQMSVLEKYIRVEGARAKQQ